MKDKIFSRLKISLLTALALLAIFSLLLVFALSNTATSEIKTPEILVFNVAKDVSIDSQKAYTDYTGNNKTYVIEGEDYNIGNFVISYRLFGETEWNAIPKDVGEYDVKITRASDENFNEFSLEIPKGLEIRKKSIKVYVVDVLENTDGYIYDGTKKTASVTKDQLAKNDDFNATLSYQLGDAPKTDSAISAGEWTVSIDEITFTAGNENNYEVDISDVGKMVITKKTVELEWQTLTASQLVYDGQEKIVTANVKPSNLIGSDVCKVVTAPNLSDNTNVGSFSFKAVSVSNSNYKLPNNAISSTFTITPRPIVLTVQDVALGTESYIYNGRQHTTVAVLDQPLIGSDEIAYVLKYTNFNSTKFDAIDAGVWTVSIESAQISQGLEKNYSIDFTDVGEINVSQKTISVSIVNIESGTVGYVYDKTAKKTDVLTTGLVGSDSVVTTLSYALGESGEKTDAIGVGRWTVAIENVSFSEGANAENYHVVFGANGFMVIDPKPIEFVWSTLNENQLVYDGNRKVLTATATNLEAGDECQISVSCKSGSDNLNVGEFSFNATSLSNENYQLSENLESAKYTISKRQLDATAKSYSVTYGDEIEEFEILFDGFVAGENSSVIDRLPTAVCRYNSTTGIVHSGIKISVQGGQDNNYYFNYIDGAVTISKRQITITAHNKISLEGERQLTLTFDYGSLVGGDSFVGTLQTDADVDVPGHYDITRGTLAINENYDIIFIAGVYTVNERNLFGSAVDGGVSSLLSMPNGVDPSAKFSVKRISENDVEWFSLPEGMEVVGAYQAALVYKDPISGQFTIKIDAPSGSSNVSNMRVVVFEDGQKEIKTLRLEGDYLSFTTTSIDQFVIIQNKNNPIGLYVVFGLIIVLFIGFFLWYTLKRRHDYKEYKF